MVNILITGGAGFIGSSISDKLTKKKYKVYIIDNLSTGNKINIPKNDKTIFFNVDVNDKKKLISKLKNVNIDYIFHFAACVGVKRTIKNPMKVLDDIEGFKNIFHICKIKKVKRIFFSSSSEVYGEGKGLPQNEEKTPLNSRLPYAVVKNIGESFCKTYHKEFKINYTIFRLFNTYGPKQSKDFVISGFIKKAINNDNITIYGDGLQSRTFCYIDDTADAIINCLEKNRFVNDIVNIGNNKVTNILNLSKTIKLIAKSHSKIIHINPLAEGDMLRRKPDVTKMKKLLGRNFTPLRVGLKKIISEIKNK